MTTRKFVPFCIPVDTEREANMLYELFDAANRYLGAAGAGMTFMWLQKLHSAAQMAQAAAKHTAENGQGNALPQGRRG